MTGAYDANGNAAQVDPTAPFECFSNALLDKNLQLIDGLADLVAHLDRFEVYNPHNLDVDGNPIDPAGAHLTAVMDTSDGSDILLGGGGSDEIRGMAGNDIIDGDQWLRVRIAITDADGNVYATASRLTSAVEDLAGNVLFAGRTLETLLFSRDIRPDQLQAVREIVDGGQAGDVDTAVYWDLRENYALSRNVDGSVTVDHMTPTVGVVDAVSGRNLAAEGTDRLFNIEQIRFADGTFTIDQLLPPPNSPATGLPLINDTTPTEGQTLTVNTAGIQMRTAWAPSATSGRSPANEGQTWTNIAGATGPSFTPNDGLLGIGGQVGGILRVAGLLHRCPRQSPRRSVSQQTAVVGDVWNAMPLLVDTTFNGTAGDDIANGANTGFFSSANDTLNGNGGNDILNGNRRQRRDQWRCRRRHRRRRCRHRHDHAAQHRRARSGEWRRRHGHLRAQRQCGGGDLPDLRRDGGPERRSRRAARPRFRDGHGNRHHPHRGRRRGPCRRTRQHRGDPRQHAERHRQQWRRTGYGCANGGDTIQVVGNFNTHQPELQHHHHRWQRPATTRSTSLRCSRRTASSSAPMAATTPSSARCGRRT